MVGVTGSIPVVPTSLRARSERRLSRRSRKAKADCFRALRLGKPSSVYCAKREACPAEALAKAGWWPRRSNGRLCVALADPPVPKSNDPPVIARAPTSVALFVGWTPRGQSGHPVGNASLLDYERFFGNDPRSVVGYAVRHFFDNGGRTAFVVRIVGADGG